MRYLPLRCGPKSMPTDSCPPTDSSHFWRLIRTRIEEKGCRRSALSCGASERLTYETGTATRHTALRCVVFANQHRRASRRGARCVVGGGGGPSEKQDPEAFVAEGRPPQAKPLPMGWRADGRTDGRARLEVRGPDADGRERPTRDYIDLTQRIRSLSSVTADTAKTTRLGVELHEPSRVAKQQRRLRTGSASDRRLRLRTCTSDFRC